MPDQKEPKNNTAQDGSNSTIPLSETIPNAHSAGNGALRLSEDGLVEPDSETIADAEAHKETGSKAEEY